MTTYIPIMIKRLANPSSIALNLNPHREQKRTDSEACSWPHFEQNIEPPPLRIRSYITASSLIGYRQVDNDRVERARERHSKRDKNLASRAPDDALVRHCLLVSGAHSPS